MPIHNHPPIQLDSAETMSRDELRALQLERLQWTLKYTYDNVPAYKAKFDAAGVHPSDLKSLEDLAKFPFTAKQDLRDNYPFGMLAVPQNQVARVHASSGTTGIPTVVGYTMKDIDTWADLMARSIRASGGRPGDMVHVSYGYGLFTGGLGAHYGAERLGCTVIPMSGGGTERQIQVIRDFKPRIIMVTPSYMLHLIEEFERQGMDPRKSSLEIGIFGAEPWTDAVRQEIEERANIDAVDIYGLSEVMGPGVGNESVETKNGPILWEDHFYPEIVHPDTGEPVADGEFGELVFTSLTKEALPVIRYRTRDLTRLLDAEDPQGRPFRRMEKITGRSDDMLIIRGVNVFPTQVEELICGQEGLSPYYEIELDRGADGLDKVKITVERAPNFDNLTTEAAAVEKLTRQIKSYIGVSTEISLAQVGKLDRSIGKAKHVFDKRQ